MPDLDEGAAGDGLARGIVDGNVDGEVSDDLAVAPDDAPQDDPDGCEATAEALAAENDALRDRVTELESALAEVERRFELERALLDAGVIDLETALAVTGGRVAGGEDPAAVVGEIVGAKPFLFRAASTSARGSALGGAAVSAGSTLSGLADEARRSGDRRALTRYLRKRRQG